MFCFLYHCQDTYTRLHCMLYMSNTTGTLTLREHLGSPPVFGGACCSFVLCYPIMCLYVLSSVLWCPLRIQHKNYVPFFICVSLRIVVSNTCCVMFMFCFSSSCVPYVASFSGLSICDCPFGIL